MLALSFSRLLLQAFPKQPVTPRATGIFETFFFLIIVYAKGFPGQLTLVILFLRGQVHFRKLSYEKHIASLSVDI